MTTTPTEPPHYATRVLELTEHNQQLQDPMPDPAVAEAIQQPGMSYEQTITAALADMRRDNHSPRRIRLRDVRPLAARCLGAHGGKNTPHLMGGPLGSASEHVCIRPAHVSPASMYPGPATVMTNSPLRFSRVRTRWT